MKYSVSKVSFFVLVLCLSGTAAAQQKGVAINKPSLDPGLILDVSGIDPNAPDPQLINLGVRFAPLNDEPLRRQLGSMYFDNGLETYRQWTTNGWQNMTSAWTFNGTSTLNSILYNGNVGVFGDFFIGAGHNIIADGGFTIFSNGPGSNGIRIAEDGDVSVSTNFRALNAIYTPFLRAGVVEESTDFGGLGFNFVSEGKSWLRTGQTFVDNLVLKINVDGNTVWRTILPTTPVVTAVPGAAPSDARLKQNIEPISNAIYRLRSLNGIAYDWNQTAISLFTKNSGAELVCGPDQDPAEFADQLAAHQAAARARYTTRETGLIAQDLQKVLPEAVVEAEDGYLRVKYGHLAGLFVEAIKEQQAIIDTQAERIRQLEALQLGVMARLERLEAVSQAKSKSSAEE